MLYFLINCIDKGNNLYTIIYFKTIFIQQCYILKCSIIA